MATKRQFCYCIYSVILVLIGIATLNLFVQKLSERKEMTEKLLSVDFEVFGKVQGVFFRKYTQEKGTELELGGWCKNTSKGTVVGHMEGAESKISEMKDWLKYKGSRSSRIDKAVFKNEKEITELEYRQFDIRQD